MSDGIRPHRPITPEHAELARKAAETFTLRDTDVISILLREVADAAFRAGVAANAKLPTISELDGAREKHVEEVIERWRSASSDKQ